MEEDHKGITKLHLMTGSDIEVYESHNFRIKELPEDFIVLGKTDHAIEFFKHKEKPIYGLQFHPEAFVDITQGKELFREIINNLIAK